MKKNRNTDENTSGATLEKPESSFMTSVIVSFYSVFQENEIQCTIFQINWLFADQIKLTIKFKNLKYDFIIINLK